MYRSIDIIGARPGLSLYLVSVRRRFRICRLIRISGGGASNRFYGNEPRSPVRRVESHRPGPFIPRARGPSVYFDTFRRRTSESVAQIRREIPQCGDDSTSYSKISIRIALTLMPNRTKRKVVGCYENFDESYGRRFRGSFLSRSRICEIEKETKKKKIAASGEIILLSLKGD